MGASLSQRNVSARLRPDARVDALTTAGSQHASSHRPLPSGTVTFAFTDIEGSTRRWEHDHAAMTAALHVHDALVRKAIEACGGDVFKTMGDAFCAVFRRPQDAVTAMLDVQRALGAEDFSSI